VEEADDDAALTDVSLLQIDVRLVNVSQPKAHLAKVLDPLLAQVSLPQILERTASHLEVEHEGRRHHASNLAHAFARLHRLSNARGTDSSAVAWVLILGLIVSGILAIFLLAAFDDHQPRRYQDSSKEASFRVQETDRPILGSSFLPSQRTALPSSYLDPPVHALASSPQPSVQMLQPRQTQLVEEPFPPICPSLILPHTEAKFMVQMDGLLNPNAAEGISICGTSGRKLLHASVSDTPDGRRFLAISSCGCEDDPRTCIATSSAFESEALEVFGKAGQFYGYLDFRGGHQAQLQWWDGNASARQPVISFALGSMSDRCINASTMDGRLLASAGRTGAVPGQGKLLEASSDTWKLTVKPGVDAVLITSCMLALLLLCPWPSQR
jgi:hypothetical protein